MKDDPLQAQDDDRTSLHRGAETDENRLRETSIHSDRSAAQ